MLHAVDGYGPLADLGFVVRGLALLVFQVLGDRQLGGEHLLSVGPPCRCAFVRHADVPELQQHGVGIVLGDDPTAHHRAVELMGILAGLPDGRHLLQVRHDVLHHPHPDVVAHAPGGDVDHADWGLDEVQFGYHAEFFCELRSGDDGVEERCVDRVHGVLQNLQPVAGVVVLLAGNHAVPFPFVGVEQRERRHLVRRAHVGEYGAIVFMGRVGAVAQAVL